MKIKSKIWIGAFFLYSIILLIGGLGIIYMLRISNASERIIRDNYLSLEASKTILRNLDEINSIQVEWIFNPDSSFRQKDYEMFVKELDNYLKHEENNITEIGEKEAVKKVRQDFEDLKSFFAFSKTQKPRGNIHYFEFVAPLVSRLRNSLNHVADINMEAIKKKNEEAKNTSHRAIVAMTLIASICFLVTFSFVVNFPSLANPIRDLTLSIREIANKNYQQKLEYNANDEFGELSEAFNTMTEKLQEYENSSLASILFEKKRIETIIRRLPDPVIGLDEQFGILFVNPAATSIFGMTDAFLIGKELGELATFNNVAAVLYNDLKTFNQGEHEDHGDWLKLGSQGKEIYYSKEYLEVSSPEHYAGKDLLGYVVLLNDVTEFKKQDAAKTNFLAMVSHELKTPIATIKMCLKLLEDKRVGRLNTEQNQLVSSIRKESERLTKITSELLNLSQIESGNIALRIAPIGLSDVIRNASELMHIHALKNKVNLILEEPEDLPSVLADEDKLEWVLINLLSNAIQHSPEGSSVVLAACRKGNFIEISVTDSGEGIPEAFQSRLFEKYYQVPGGRKDGTGLGLAISREFITAMKGFIGVRSEEGKGSVFMFTLPVFNA